MISIEGCRHVKANSVFRGPDKLPPTAELTSGFVFISHVRCPENKYRMEEPPQQPGALESERASSTA